MSVLFTEISIVWKMIINGAIRDIKRQKVRAVLSSSLSSRAPLVLWKLEAYASGSLSARGGHPREVEEKE